MANRRASRAQSAVRARRARNRSPELFVDRHWAATAQYRPTPGPPQSSRAAIPFSWCRVVRAHRPPVTRTHGRRFTHLNCRRVRPSCADAANPSSSRTRARRPRSGGSWRRNDPARRELFRRRFLGDAAAGGIASTQVCRTPSNKAARGAARLPTTARRSPDHISDVPRGRDVGGDPFIQACDSNVPLPPARARDRCRRSDGAETTARTRRRRATFFRARASEKQHIPARGAGGRAPSGPPANLR